MAGFKFEIGEVVITRAAMAECELAAKMGGDIQPVCYTINERIAQECPGGVQLQYKIFRHDGHRVALEHELARPDEFDAAAVYEIGRKVRAEERRLDNEQHNTWLGKVIKSHDK